MKGMPMIAYPAKLTRDRISGGYVVTFPDIPEAITEGDSIEESLEHAADALESAMDFYFEERRAVPVPSPIRKGMYAVELPSSVTAKILLLNAMIESNVRPAELARRMGVTRQDVQRLTDLKHASKIDGISAALHALGKRLQMKLA
jgi:antitoxin HicB